jgi:tetratricopeptide (TPR) repeat protein
MSYIVRLPSLYCLFYEVALSSGLRCFSLLNNAAVALKRQGKFDRAFELYTMALQEDPKNGLLLMNAGMLAESIGNKFEAINYYSQAVKVDPKNERLQNRFGLLKRRLDLGPA